MKCQRCKDVFGFKDSHYMIDIYNQNNFPVTLCNRHKNFKPNKLIVWLDHKWHVHFKFPRTQMRIHSITYREAKNKYFALKYWQSQTIFKN